MRWDGLGDDGEEGGGDFGFDHELQVEQFDDEVVASSFFYYEAFVSGKCAVGHAHSRSFSEVATAFFVEHRHFGAS